MRTIEYVTTHTGLKVMKEFYMRRYFWHKGSVWILSVVEGRALWSIHETGDEVNKRSEYYGPKFRLDHEKQIQELHNQAVREDAEEAKLKTIDDQTDSSRQIIKALKR